MTESPHPKATMFKLTYPNFRRKLAQPVHGERKAFLAVTNGLLAATDHGMTRAM